MNSYVLMLQIDEDDKEIVETALAELGMNVSVKYLSDINDLDGLVRNAGKPSLIMLSESNTRSKAIENLKKLKSNNSYNHIPVIVLAEQSPASYVSDYYRAGANSFVIKPSSVELTRKKIEICFKYWSEVAEVENNSTQPQM